MKSIMRASSNAKNEGKSRTEKSNGILVACKIMEYEEMPEHEPLQREYRSSLYTVIILCESSLNP